MELNEVTKKLPAHLLQFVVDQPYNEYTPVDQAVWRYVMRQNYHHLTKVAHESYIKGLKLTGVEIEQIPTMYGMNRILKDIGWAAVAVDGFIPPGAFMEFTKYNVLVIAADIRTLEHIEYTPAPDVIHESAGHAPILAVPEFAAYLKHIGEAGSKAFSSQKDVELYEAIRHLSIIKEDPSTVESEVKKAEEDIERIQKNMGPPSEMALIRNLHWWTVEYGLIGTVNEFKLYGAGLLSSIGEGMSCLSAGVKKYPYTIEAMHCNYDITKPQPQLFVTPDFAHLNKVLDEFKKLMAWTTGGLSAIQKAIDSQHTGTLVFSSGLQISGTFTRVIESEDKPIFFATTGASALSVDDIQLNEYGKEKFPNGFSSPVGRLAQPSVFLENSSEDDLNKAGIRSGNSVHLQYENGIEVDGVLRAVIRSKAGKVILLDFANVTIKHNGKMLVDTDSYIMGVGEKITSAFAGPADSEAFQPTIFIPKEKMHKFTYDDKALELHDLYRFVRKARTDKSLLASLPDKWKTVISHFPNDWLLSMEILEILQVNTYQPELQLSIYQYLEEKREKEPSLNKLITNGLNLLNTSLYKERV